MENNEKKIVWKEFTTKKGHTYEVGYLVEPDFKEEKPQKNRKSPFTIACNWPPTVEETWIKPTQEFKNTTAIKQYSVNNHSGNYSYIINFDCTEHYDYHFFDEEGDSYRCNVYTNGKHYIRYNSARPRIVRITGT